MEMQYSNEKMPQNGLKHHEVAVLMVPFLAQGHLNQLLHLSGLITTYGIPVHYVGTATYNRQATVRLHGWDSEEWPDKVHFHDFELPPYDSPEPKPNPSMHFPVQLQPLWDASVHLRQPVYQLLQQLSNTYRRIIVIHDALMASVVQDVKFIPNAESYNFIPISAFTKLFNSWNSLPERPFQLDSDVPRFVPSNEGCYTPDMEKFIANQRRFSSLDAGRLYNTSRLIEGKYVELLEKLSADADIKHFAIGPLNPVEMKRRNEKERHRCLEWLDEQEAGSVLYVSFKSNTSLTDEQIEELAVGLEQSGQKFIWVLRIADRGTVLAEGEVCTPQLPEGYGESVKKRGMVIRDWAPQLDILAHTSTCGFISHCGWNSCIESISMGVPIAAWPMHTDQPRNTILVTEVLKNWDSGERLG